MAKKLSHVDARGQARMVDVSSKTTSARVAVARAELSMKESTRALILDGKAKKGDVLATARIAGIQAAKKTSELIPLCHPLALTGVTVEIQAAKKKGVLFIETRVTTTDRTGVEMEALTAAAIAALTIYDMVKAVDRGIAVSRIELLQKSGGRSGVWKRAT